MPSISIAVIAHNEEKNVFRCLSSVDWATEVIFVDCDSSDGTASAAAKFPVKYFSRPNSTTVYVNKQFAIDQASSDWVLILDADEEVPPVLREEIEKTLPGSGETAAYTIPRKNFYFGRWLRHGGKYPDTQLRLFRKGRAHFIPLPVHERLEVNGSIGKLTAPLLHYPYSSPEDMRRKLGFYTEVLVKSYSLKKKNRLMLLARPFTRFISNYVFKMGFLDGAEGWHTASMDFRTIMASVLVYLKAGGAK